MGTLRALANDVNASEMLRAPLRTAWCNTTQSFSPQLCDTVVERFVRPECDTRVHEARRA
eukprot:5572856-Prymnesium_polylepis.1